MQTQILTIWNSIAVVTGMDLTMPVESLSKFIVDMANNNDLDSHVLWYPDGRDHVKLQDLRSVANELNKHFVPEYHHGKKYIMIAGNWRKPDDNPFIYGDHIRNSPHLYIPRTPFVEWLPDLSHQQNRVREITCLLESQGFRGIPMSIGGIIDYIENNIKNDIKMFPQMYVLIDHIGAATNMGDHFEGPIGDLKVTEDKILAQSEKLKIIRAVGKQAFALEKAKSGEGMTKPVIIEKIGKVAYEVARRKVPTM